MKKENKDFYLGLFAGLCLGCLITITLIGAWTYNVVGNVDLGIENFEVTLDINETKLVEAAFKIAEKEIGIETNLKNSEVKT